MLKTIIITIIATLTVATLAAYLSLNTVLGVFGLAATSVEILSKLQASQKIVDTMKARHARKHKRIPGFPESPGVTTCRSGVRATGR